MAGSLLGIGEESRGLDDQLDPEIAPRNLGRVALGEDLDGPTVDNDVAVGGFDGTGIASVVGVVLEEVGVGLGVREIVDGYDFELVGMSLEYGAGDLPSDPAEAVNADPGGHSVPPIMANRTLARSVLGYCCSPD